MCPRFAMREAELPTLSRIPMNRIRVIVAALALVAIPAVSHAQQDTTKKPSAATKAVKTTEHNLHKAGKATRTNAKHAASATKTNASNAASATKTNASHAASATKTNASHAASATKTNASHAADAT